MIEAEVITEDEKVTLKNALRLRINSRDFNYNLAKDFLLISLKYYNITYTVLINPLYSSVYLDTFEEVTKKLLGTMFDRKTLAKELSLRDQMNPTTDWISKKLAERFPLFRTLLTLSPVERPSP